LAEATALLTELESQEPLTDADPACATAADEDTPENAPSIVHFTMDPDENDVFDQPM